MKLHKLVDLEIDAVAAVDKPANKRKWLVVKRDEDATVSVTKQETPPNEMDVDLVAAILDYEIAKRDVAAAKFNDPTEIWKQIQEKAKYLRYNEPSLSEAEAIERVIQENPDLAERYNQGFRRNEAEERLAKAEAWLKAQRKAAALQKREPGLTRQEALAKVFDAEPELYRRV